MVKPSETIYKGWIEGKDEKCEACDAENKKRYSWKTDTKTCLGAMAMGPMQYETGRRKQNANKLKD